MRQNSCCFIGHRKVNCSEDLRQKVSEIVESLFVKNNVTRFLFGSRSEFNTLCLDIVSELKKKHPTIIRIDYSTGHELAMLETDRKSWEKIFSLIPTKDSKRLYVVEEIIHKTRYDSGRASYVERNQEMIDDSDYCIFYYDQNYLPPPRRLKGAMTTYQTKSGTRIAYEYAKRKKKHIINVFS